MVRAYYVEIYSIIRQLEISHGTLVERVFLILALEVLCGLFVELFDSPLGIKKSIHI